MDASAGQLYDGDGSCTFLARSSRKMRIVTVSSILGDPSRFEDGYRALADLVFVVPVPHA